MGLFSFLSRPRVRTADIARERLQIVLSHERASRDAPDFLPILQKELVAVVARFVEVRDDTIRVNVGKSGDTRVLEINIEIDGAKLALTAAGKNPLRSGAARPAPVPPAAKPAPPVVKPAPPPIAAKPAAPPAAITTPPPAATIASPPAPAPVSAKPAAPPAAAEPKETPALSASPATPEKPEPGEAPAAAKPAAIVAAPRAPASVEESDPEEIAAPAMPLPTKTAKSS